MSAKGNQFKKNSNETAPVEERQTSFKNPFGSLANFKINERPKKIFGLILLLFSFCLLIAFTSFLFTWQNDQDKIFNSTWDLLFDPGLLVENWLGKLGAILAHFFIHNLFGVISYLFVFLFFITGFKILTGVSITPILKAYRFSFFVILWVSVLLGFLFKDIAPIAGGAFGFHVSLWLNSIIGTAGTGLLLFFIFIGSMVAVFNISFDFLNSLFSKTEINTETEDLAGFDLKSNTLNPFNKPLTETQQLEEQETDVLNLEEEVPEITLKNEANKIPFILEDDFEELEVVKNEKTEELISSELEIENNPVEDEELEVIENKSPFGEYDPTLDLSSYKFPNIDLLEKHGSSSIVINKDELEENKNKILETLKNYNIGIAKIKATIGPTVTLYEIIPDAGVRISKIKNLEDDIALSLSALGIRIIAPIPGKGTIGIEVPNQKPEIVSMRSVIASEKFQNTDMELPIALGKTISNETFIADLAKMPHLLMAGATGQGKSVGLNAILVSLLYKKHPSQVKFVLVDPKKVELTLFNKIERHFLAKLPGNEEAIITDTKKVVNTLNSLCIEMDQRYELLKNGHVRNIKEYNTKFIARKLNPEQGHKFLPYIVLVVDEFADLIMTAGKEVETPIARLAQLARAIGIHLIIATQRPSVNIITGTIKANFPARIAFRVTSRIDSRTILDSGGADQLIGRGDMLLSTGSDIIRLQCAFVDTPEVDEITEFIGSQRGYAEAFLLPEYVDDSEGGTGKAMDASERDSMFVEAAKIVVIHQQGSASLLQRRLKLGYNRAGRIIDQLEASGIIGPFEGSKARQVLIPDEVSLEQFLKGE
ncbi:MAG: DNA translocase FtsK [Bacteroidetes bacterium]|nr:DNA translocase FtsK [Bacteroidota bacterium]HET6245871.1 DNA translocase FtsK [Bacteroidia bacterium]